MNVKDGTFHMLTRDARLTGEMCTLRHSWSDGRGNVHYYAIEGKGVRPTEAGRRGKVAADGSGNVWFMVPGNVDESLVVGRR